MSDTNEKQPAIAPEGAKVKKIPGVKASVAVGREVVVRVPDVDQSYRGRVVGYDPYNYIIINVRLSSKIRSELSGGGQVILKYLHKGTVYGFRAYVIDAIRTPAPLLFIEYPSVIEKIELRRQTRCEVSLDGMLHTNDGPHECLVINLSATGCKVSARATAKDPISATGVDDTVVVAFNLGEEGALKLPMAVRNIKREKGIITLGGMFLDMLDKEEKAIGEYLEKVQRLTL
ncbi:MAG: flagellar brake protein [Desulfovibrionaceae bacterium]|nr:flagellar brake protein [Desulfovibrionaceae bacterium]